MHPIAIMKLELLPVVSLALLASLSGCVSQGKYDQALAEQQRLRDRVQRDGALASDKDAQCQARIAKITRDLRASTVQRQMLDQQLALTADTSRSYKQKLDETMAMSATLRGELMRLGNDVDKLLGERGTLASSLADARKRLDELNRAQAAAESRAALFRSLAKKLQKMIDAGELRIVLRDGRMMLVLPNDVVFDSGKAQVKPAGRRALDQISAALVSLRGREFQVAGHTDDEPIRVSGYPSNWALSTARSLAVVEHLVKQGMQPQSLSAAGYGEFDPVAANDSTEGRARNRRIEITLQPQIDELVAVP